jgi:hypothetical protein
MRLHEVVLVGAVFALGVAVALLPKFIRRAWEVN